jgi:hypothetical protein
MSLLLLFYPAVPPDSLLVNTLDIRLSSRCLLSNNKRAKNEIQGKKEKLRCINNGIRFTRMLRLQGYAK